MKFITTIFIFTILTSCVAQKNAIKDNTSAEIKVINDEELIRNCFSNYKSAILNDKGNEAAEYVDTRTIRYYTEILNKTKTADSIEVSKMNIMDKLMLFSIRHRTSKEEIIRFDGKKLLIYAIREGMVGKNSVVNNAIGEIEVDNNFAKGQIMINRNPAPFYFHFYKEKENWKIDLTSIFPIATQAFQKMADESGQAENDYLFMLLEMITGNRPTSNIWETIK